MKKLIILLFILNAGAVRANENILFMMIPACVSTDVAIASVKSAALKRQWTAHAMEDNKLRIELDHRGYKAVLKFDFSEKEILYTDSTTYFSNDFDEDSEGEWVSTSAPGSWITNLRNDVNALFAMSRGCAL